MTTNLSKKLSALARNLFLILGAVLLLLLIRGVGWEEIIREMRLVGWGLIPYIGIHALKEALTTSAWKATLPDSRRGSWWKLYLIIWAGATVNKIYHTGFLGGDITRVVLVRKDVSTSQGVASVLIVAGMWLERYTIVVPTLNELTGRGYEYAVYRPARVEYSITVASICGFVLLYVLFAKLFPIISIWEVEEAEEAIEARVEGMKSYLPTVSAAMAESQPMTPK